MSKLDIPYNKLTLKQLQAHCEVMRKGNSLLRTCADQLDMEYRKFRILLFKGLNAGASPVIPNLNPKQLAQITAALPFIKAVRNIEWGMICGFSLLVRKRADKWTKRNQGGITNYEDFEQEGFMALIDSIYNYTKVDVKFITFVQWAIDRRLITAAKRNNPMCPLTNDAMCLVERYEEAKRLVNGPVSSEEVIASLNITDNEAQTIRDCLVQVSGSSGDEDIGPDYSENRCGIDRERPEPVSGDYHLQTIQNVDGEEEATIPLNYELREAIAKANLTAIELKVLETYMVPHYGWQEELASQTINPVTSVRYTRQAISVILGSALKKVKRVYLHHDQVA